MSVKHIGLILDHFDAKPAIKLVAIILADHADSDGICWPSYRRISERANMDERTVRRHVKELINLGILTKLRTGSLTKKDGQILRITNAYRVNEHIIVNRKKLSPRPLLVSDTTVHLDMDKNSRSRGAGLSTKPSLNHKSNHQGSKPVDNSREPVTLDEVFANMMEGKR